jgi:ABC-type multidrug transport system fused ATPase/permease subunit
MWSCVCCSCSDDCHFAVFYEGTNTRCGHATRDDCRCHIIFSFWSFPSLFLVLFFSLLLFCYIISISNLFTQALLQALVCENLLRNLGFVVLFGIFLFLFRIGSTRLRNEGLKGSESFLCRPDMMDKEKDIELGLDSPPQSPVSWPTTPPRGSSYPAMATASRHGIEHDELHVTTTQYSNQLSLSAVDPIDVKVRNLAVQVDTSPSPLSLGSLLPRKRKANEPTTKTILHDVSADMPRGTLTAIIGGSGSGKTTMLNTMAERITSGRLTITGKTTFNEQQGINNIRSAYVMQQDVLLPTLTERETL